MLHNYKVIMPKKNNMELIMLPQAFGCILRKIAFVKNKHLLKFP